MADKSNNFIVRLKLENERMETIIRAQENMITNFRAHLQSSKFQEDTTIQVRDVDAWLVQMWRKITEPVLLDGEEG